MNVRAALLAEARQATRYVTVPLLGFWPRIASVVAFRWACFGVMMALCLLAERRPAPHLPDLIVDRLPYLSWVDRWNSWLLLVCYIPVSVLLLLRDPARFCRYTVSTGLLSLCRGVCIVLTGLGPVHGADINAHMPARVAWAAWLELVSPFGLLVRDAPHLYMTKDLFFSGHTGVTFLLLLYVSRDRLLRRIMLPCHLLVVGSVFLAHLHYSIDVVGAYAVAFAIFALREGWPQGLRGQAD